jgi:ADP-heptose:LPS heptosyltransferase
LTRILVIRLGALGDFVQSFGPFAAIRAHHAGAHIALLTTRPFLDLARLAPWFDEVLLDERPEWWNVAGLARLSRMLRGFDFVYDLQTSSRSSRYFRLVGRPPWSGIAPGCSHPHADPRRDFMHTRERQREQLAVAGVTDFPSPDLSWLTGGESAFGLPSQGAVLVPGAAPHRPAKRWPAARFAALAQVLAGRGLTPVVLGTEREAPAAGLIAASCPEAIDLTGRTTLADIAAIAARARVAVGNDTGPMHVAAAVGCPCVALFSGDSDPDLTAPRYPGGGWPTILRVPDLADLSVERVAAALP